MRKQRQQHRLRQITAALITTLITVMVVGGFGTPGSRAAAAPGETMRHAVWIGHGWVNGTPLQSVPDLLDHLTAQGATAVMVNTGRLDQSGRIEDPATTMERWLEQVQTWEQQSGRRFELWAWVSAKTDRTRIEDQAVQTNIVGEAQRLMAVRSPNGRGFDGLITDIEPVGLDPERFEAYLHLVERIREAVGKGRTVGVAAPRFRREASTVWFWEPEQFYQMAQHADVVIVNTYNTALQAMLGATGEEYAAWMAEQTGNILTAVSGQYWEPDRLPPRAGFRLYLSAPAYEPLVHASSSISHDPGIENTRYAVRGIRQGIERLRESGSTALRYLEGIALYGHTDGTGADGFAMPGRDWAWWARELSAPEGAVNLPAPRNAAWLGPEWLSGQVGKPDPLLDQLHAAGVRHLLVNVGAPDPSGRVPTQAEVVRDLIAAVQAWEWRRGERLTLWAWLPAQPDRTDIRRKDVQERIAAESARILSVQGPGGRRFEGVVTDLAPAGRSLLEPYMDLLDGIHRAIGWWKPVGVSAPPYGAEPWSEGSWSMQEFYYIARHSDFLIAGAHDPGLSAAAEADPDGWAEAQVRDILGSVSGQYWRPARPGPREHFQVFFTLPPGASGEVAAGGIHGALERLRTGEQADLARLVRGLAIPGGSANLQQGMHTLLRQRLEVESNSLWLYVALQELEADLGLHQELDTFVLGRKIGWDVRPFVEQGRTLVPVRKLMEALDAEVSWDPAQQTVTIRKFGIRAVFRMGDQIARVNDQEIQLEVPPRIVAGRTVVPVRAVVESLGLHVSWLVPFRTILVTSGPVTD